MDAKKTTIMVVDDNPDIINIVKTILEGKGYNVVGAYSGQELLTHLENQKPDLIILDIMMPQMDGLEVLTRLKGATETSSIPVILLTAKVQYVARRTRRGGQAAPWPSVLRCHFLPR